MPIQNCANAYATEKMLNEKEHCTQKKQNEAPKKYYLELKLQHDQYIQCVFIWTDTKKKRRIVSSYQVYQKNQTFIKNTHTNIVKNIVPKNNNNHNAT